MEVKPFYEITRKNRAFMILGSDPLLSRYFYQIFADFREINLQDRLTKGSHHICHKIPYCFFLPDTAQYLRAHTIPGNGFLVFLTLQFP